MTIKTTRPKPHDAHVRAYRVIIRRVVDRSREWHGRPLTEAEAVAKLRRFRWPRYDWGLRQTGSYHEFGGYDGPKVPYKEIPAAIIHGIMCS